MQFHSQTLRRNFGSHLKDKEPQCLAAFRKWLFATVGLQPVKDCADQFAQVERIYLQKLQGTDIGEYVLASCLKFVQELSRSQLLGVRYLYAHELYVKCPLRTGMICQLYHGYLQGLSMFPRPLIGYKCGLLYCYFSDCQPKVDETLVDLIAYLQEEVSNFPICKQGLKKKPHRLKMFTKVYKPIQTGPKKQGESTTTKRLKAQLLLFESYLVAGRLHRDQEKQQYFGNCLIRLQEQLVKQGRGLGERLQKMEMVRGEVYHEFLKAYINENVVSEQTRKNNTKTTRKYSLHGSAQHRSPHGSRLSMNTHPIGNFTQPDHHKGIQNVKSFASSVHSKMTQPISLEQFNRKRCDLSAANKENRRQFTLRKNQRNVGCQDENELNKNKPKEFIEKCSQTDPVSVQGKVNCHPIELASLNLHEDNRNTEDANLKGSENEYLLDTKAFVGTRQSPSQQRCKLTSQLGLHGEHIQVQIISPEEILLVLVPLPDSLQGCSQPNDEHRQQVVHEVSHESLKKHPDRHTEIEINIHQETERGDRNQYRIIAGRSEQEPTIATEPQASFYPPIQNQSDQIHEWLSKLSEDILRELFESSLQQQFKQRGKTTEKDVLPSSTRNEGQIDDQLISGQPQKDRGSEVGCGKQGQVQVQGVAMTELKEEDIHREGKEFGDEKVDEEEFIRTEECRIFDGEITPQSISNNLKQELTERQQASEVREVQDIVPKSTSVKDCDQINTNHFEIEMQQVALLIQTLYSDLVDTQCQPLFIGTTSDSKQIRVLEVARFMIDSREIVFVHDQNEGVVTATVAGRGAKFKIQTNCNGGIQTVMQKLVPENLLDLQIPTESDLEFDSSDLVIMDLWTVRDTVTLHFRHQSDTIKLDFALHEKITRVKSTMKTIYRLEGTDGLHSEFLLSSFGKIKKLHNNLSTVIGYCLHIREGSPFLADENIDRLIELI